MYRSRGNYILNELENGFYDLKGGSRGLFQKHPKRDVNARNFVFVEQVNTNLPTRIMLVHGYRYCYNCDFFFFLS